MKRLGDELQSLRLCAEAGLVALEPPQRMPGIARALRNWGPLGGSVAVAALRHGDRVAVIDELGSLTFTELDQRSNALANAWREHGLRAGDGVAILVRNHRGFLDATFATAKLGARAILLNTEFAGPQIRDVAKREGTRMLVHDDEYSSLLDGVEAPLGKFRAWAEDSGADTLDALIAGADPSPPPKAESAGSIVILTSGTTGTPKGATREQPRSLTPLGAVLSKVPLRGRETTVICAPLFHALGFAHAVLGVALGSTIVLRRRFDPAAAVNDLERTGASGLIVVPVMLRRILDSIDEDPNARDLSKLRIAFVAGAQLGGPLATRAAKMLGEVVYNLYGSTEVAYATIATPQDLRAAPDCVGSPTLGAVVEILDDEGRALATGATGRIFVGNSAPFEGYTGGGSKQIIDGLMATGDVGHFDGDGRLYIDGRDDDMIVSGGENVFPGEIEELLAGHDEIVEAAALGVPDEKFGQRLQAFVVRDGESTLTEDAVRNYVRDHLARYKVPREVVFLDELPRNPTGKVLKRELAARGA